ncbi:hypothetical protein [Roseimicrobium sp. ORNL1]|uniref:hypothetical protein n=1 Tax=Roseimicrobium sp. ORNL1 TaxID=2711231 RepID=UPI0013E2030D|nr:hypothetical protein [Roseimicrobium sp. ORNL1]QIF04643.1 hypothetical protein G5S37_24975 [Roseimicrobium sp. ORNL1]
MSAEAKAAERYPWYDLVDGDELQQGDILFACPFYKVVGEPSEGEAELQISEQTAVILTQSCDLALRRDGTYGVENVILCPLLQKHELASDATFSKRDSWNQARKGQMPAYHVLNRFENENVKLDYALADLSNLFTLPIETVKSFARNLGSRPRLNHPYCEHLSQAFARFFMRVGLPVDIPHF